MLSHVMEDGSEKPLGFMSRTLSPAEKRYSQLDKEGLAIIFGIKRFHKEEEDDTWKMMEDPPITTAQLKQWTAKDETLKCSCGV